MRVANRTQGCLTLLIGSLASQPLAADEIVSLVGSTSTTYKRLEIAQHHTDQVSTRLVFQDSQARWGESDHRTVLTANIFMRSAASLIDYHPFDNDFRVTTGIYLPNHEIMLHGSASMPSFGAQPLQTMTAFATVSYQAASPYLGIGWASDFGAGRNGRYSIDVGVIDLGVPNVSLSMGGTAYAAIRASDDLLANQKIRKEIDQWKQELSRYRYFPIVTMSLNWWF